MNGYAAHSVTYGPDGEVLSVTVHEPRFTVGEKMLLLQARRNALAPRGEHGWLMSEATDRKNMGRFEISEPADDYAQMALIEGRERLKAKYGEEMLAYKTFHVRKKS